MTEFSFEIASALILMMIVGFVAGFIEGRKRRIII